MNAVYFHFLQSFFRGLCFNAQEWAWSQCMPQPPVLVCLSGAGCYGASLSVWCWSLWCQSICQVLVAMIPVCLSGPGCYGTGLSVRSWLLWYRSACQVLVAMVPVCLSGTGCYSDCLMLLIFRIWSKEISLYWKWAVDLEKWRPSIWWPLCRECHCDPTGKIVSGIMLKIVYPVV